MNYIKVKPKRHKILVRALMQIRRQTESNEIYQIADQALEDYKNQS